MKRCWWCQSFELSLGAYSYGEYTPGSPGNVRCWKDKFDFGPESDHDVFEVVHKAETCEHYKLSDKVKP